MVLDAAGDGLPRIAHWGADLGEAVDLDALVAAATPPVPRAGLDVRVPVSLVPERAAGYRGRPGLSGSRGGAAWSPSFRLTAVEREGATIAAEDPDAGLGLRCELRLAPSGVLAVRHTLRNDGADAVRARRAARACCRCPARRARCSTSPGAGAASAARSGGRWRTARGVRERRRGRTGHDAPLLMVAGTPGFGFRSGEVWARPPGLERRPRDAGRAAARRHGACSAPAELLAPGEVRARAGREYATPWLYARLVRPRPRRPQRGAARVAARPARRTRARPRPVVLNTWEAVYFDHDLERLTRPRRRRGAARGGAVRARRRLVRLRAATTRPGSATGTSRPDVWPDGLTPLVDHVRGLGHGVRAVGRAGDGQPRLRPRPRAPGLGAARAPGRLPPPWRHQQVLDLAEPGRVRARARPAATRC